MSTRRLSLQRPRRLAAARDIAPASGATIKRSAITVNKQRSVHSIEIGFTLIKVLEQAARPLSLTEVARDACMAVSKAHLYMVSFKRVGLVAQHDDTKRYTLGPYALELGLSVMRRLDIVEASREIMRALSYQIQESVFLSVWGSHGPTIIYKVDGPRRIPLTLQIGYILPLLRSATGRIFLSYLPEQVTSRCLKEEVAALSSAAMDADVIKTRTRELELAQTDSLLNDGFAGVSAPVWDHHRELAGAITVISMSAGLSFGDSSKIACLRDATHALSHALGAPTGREKVTCEAPKKGFESRP